MVASVVFYAIILLGVRAAKIIRYFDVGFCASISLSWVMERGNSVFSNLETSAMESSYNISKFFISSAMSRKRYFGLGFCQVKSEPNLDYVCSSLDLYTLVLSTFPIPVIPTSLPSVQNLV